MQADVLTLRKGPQRTWQALVAGCADVVAVLPIPVIAAAYLIRPGFGWVWLLTLIVSVVVGVGMAAIGTGRSANLSLILVSLVVGVGFAWLLRGSSGMAGALGCGVFATVVAVMSGQHWRSDSGLTGVPLYFVGLLVHFVALVLFHHLPTLAPWTLTITLSGLASVGVLCWAMNESRLETLVLDKDLATGLPKRVTRFNRSLVLAFTAIIVLVFAVRPMQHAASRLWWWLIALFGRIASWLAHLFLTKPRPGQHPTPKKPPLLPGKHQKPPVMHPHPLTWYEKAILFFLLAVLVGALVWVIWKKLIPALRAWFRAWMEAKEGPELGYVDTTEHIGAERSPRKRRLPNRQLPRWDTLTPGEKVRRLYRTVASDFARAGYPIQTSHTAAETTDAMQAWQSEISKVGKVSKVHHHLTGTTARHLSDLYNQVRYGSTDTTDGEVEQLKQSLEGKPGQD